MEQPSIWKDGQQIGKLYDTGESWIAEKEDGTVIHECFAKGIGDTDCYYELVEQLQNMEYQVLNWQPQHKTLAQAQPAINNNSKRRPRIMPPQRHQAKPKDNEIEM